MKYTTPNYEVEAVEVRDVITVSVVASGNGYTVYSTPEEGKLEAVVDVEALI